MDKTLKGCLFSLLLPAFALAGSHIEISPLKLDLSANNPIQSLTVTNPTAEPMLVQLELTRWQQQKGKDNYAPTKDLLVNPPIISLQPKAQQIIRVGMRHPAVGTNELAYRLYIQEVPKQQVNKGLKVQLRIGIPIFVAPTVPAKTAFQSRVKLLKNDSYQVTIINVGNTHLKCEKLEFVNTKTHKTIGSIMPNAYLLPGQANSWNMTLVGITPSQLKDAKLLMSTDTTVISSDKIVAT